MGRDSFGYTHGDSGTKPSSLDFTANQRPNPQNFDWFWNKVVTSINAHANEFDRLDSDDDGVVDSADDADTVDGQHADSFVDEAGDSMSGNLNIEKSDPKISLSDTSSNDWDIVHDVSEDELRFTWNGGPRAVFGSSGLIDFSGYGSNLRLKTGQSIEDGGGTDRFELTASNTIVRDSDGVTGLQLRDDSGGNPIVEIGTSLTPRSLRFPTGQAIEDGSGTDRINIFSGSTALDDDEGDRIITGGSGTPSGIELRPRSGKPLKIRDKEGNFDAVTYTTSASSPGTFDATNAIIQEQGDRVATRVWTTSGNIDHADLGTTTSDDHHSRYTDSEARDAVEAGNVAHVQFANIEDVGSNQIGLDESEGILVDWGNGTAPLWDGYNVSGGNAISISNATGASASPTIAVNESGISHDNISGVSSSDHHSRYTDSEAVSAVDAQIDTAATSIASLDNTVAGKIDSSNGVASLNLTIQSSEPDLTLKSTQTGGTSWDIRNGFQYGNGLQFIEGGTEQLAIDDGNLEVSQGNVDVQENSVTTNNFEVTENSATNSLDFNYTGS